VGRSSAVAEVQRIGRLPQLLLPNLGAVIAAVTLFYCLFVYNGGTQLFRDSDTGWHIRNGEQILSTRTLPRTDPYSFSKARESWFAWEWGADVLMGAVHRAGGLRALAALFSLAIAACLWLCCRLHFVAGGDFFLLALFAPLTVTATSLHWLARPHVLSWLFLLAALLYAETAPLRFGPRQAAIISGATALWANVHASFLLAPAIALVYAAGYYLRPLLWPLDRYHEWRRARWFLFAALASLAGSLLNPYGWRLHAHVLSYLRDSELTSRIAEFQSFNFQQSGAVQVALTLAVALAGAILALGQKKLAHAILAGLLVWGGLRSARILPLVALVALPFANRAIAEALDHVQGMRWPVQRAIRETLAYSERVRFFDRRLSGAGFLAISVLLALVAFYAESPGKIGFPPDRFPVAAAQAVEKLPSTARILAIDSFGGYLIYRFEARRKVYIDGRSDFYGAELMKQYLRLTEVRPGWREIVRSFGFTHALLPVDSPLHAAFAQAGWTILYKDNVAVLLEAR